MISPGCWIWHLHVVKVVKSAVFMGEAGAKPARSRRRMESLSPSRNAQTLLCSKTTASRGMKVCFFHAPKPLACEKASRLRRDAFFALRESHRNTECGAGSPPHAGGSFFFTKKAYCGNQTLCVAESRKSVQTQPHPFSALKKALKKDGNPRGARPPWRSSRQSLEVLLFIHL